MIFFIFRMPGMDNPIDENKIVSKFLVDSNQAVKFKLVRNEEEIQNDKVRFCQKPTQDDPIL